MYKPVKFSPVVKTFAVGSIAALALSACAANENGGDSSGESSSDSKKELSGEIVGAGASSQKAAQGAWAAGFQEMHPDVTVNYDPTGSGAGRETFVSGASMFAGTDAAFETEEIKKAAFKSCKDGSGIVEFPAYISPIALAYNIEGVKDLKLDAETIAGIFAGKITKWNDPAIKKQNPDANLPDAAIHPVHRSDKSGTTENFTDYLSAAAPDVWDAGVIEEWPEKYGGEGAQGTSGVVSAVKNGVNTIGYADASQVGDLGTVQVKVGDEYVPYSPEAAAKIVAKSPVDDGRAEGDMAINLDRKTSESGTYPIVLVSYLVGCQQYKDEGAAEKVKAYFNYVVSEDGQQAAQEAAGSAPLSDSLREKITPIIDSIK